MDDRPALLITGASGNIGSELAARLGDRFRVVGFDLDAPEGRDDLIDCDLTDDASVELALRKLKERAGSDLAAVIHLAAYFDFSGERRPMYREVNVEGTRRLMRGLQGFRVGRFVYSGTMLVHEARDPGERIDEETPLDPGWAYPESKAETEKVIREEANGIPYVLLHLAGLYDDETAVPTLSHQIARIWERDMKAHVYSGDLQAGQAFIHLEDMLDLFDRVVERRDDLPPDAVILAGEPDVMSYRALQDRLGRLIHGEETWETLTLPAPLAKAGAAVETASEPVIPDAYDEGEKPFIRPFMIDMASDHYALDISRARELLGWEPRHRIRDGLVPLVEALKRDPLAWYQKNGITPPVWLRAAEERVDDAEALRVEHETASRAEHRSSLWAHFANVGLGIWLVVSPPLLGYDDAWMILSQVVSGLALAVLGFVSLSWRFPQARFAAAAVGFWIMFAPLVTWTDSGTAYLNGSLTGMFAMAFALATRPSVGVSPVAARTGPKIPKGWDYSPSDWFQRLPVILLAVAGFVISYYLTAYQLETIPGVWDPLFGPSPDAAPGQNGTEAVITSSVSEAWPVPDAGVGAVTYALEIVVGLIGSSRRWRTMPWLVVLFGIMIVPLGAVSIFFIVIQPIVIGTYCTLCLVAAAAMLLQIPYSLDELVATYQFLRRRHRAGQPWLKVFFIGGTDEGPDQFERDDFERSPREIVIEMVTGGMTFPWTLLASIGVGVLLMLSPLVFGWQSGIAGTAHIVGALAITVSVAALATIARLARFLNALMGAILLFAPFVAETTWLATGFAIVCGLALIGLSVPRGRVSGSYGDWDRFIR